MQVVIFPEPGYEGEKYWQPAINGWHRPGIELRKQLEAKGYSVSSYPCEISSNVFGIYYGAPNNVPALERCLSIQLEPPIVPGRAIYYYNIKELPFDRILTFVRDYVDNKKIFWEPVPTYAYSFDKYLKRSKYICAISGGGKEFQSVTIKDKVFYSLFNARRLAYLSWGKDLDLYGKGWENDEEMINACNYKGPVEDKILTLSQYKYAIVFENCDKIYTSEKYWDCVQAGTIPLYRGQWPDYPFEYCDIGLWASRIVSHVGAICSTK